mmetsp:Transcript_25946/g.78118  ORF Transcript_25946/g.78118 Transcript_25946/m.78118 type:complete len:254 (+) Transcript_25946:1138-1899(+)
MRPPAKSSASDTAQKPAHHVTKAGALPGYFFFDRRVWYTVRLLRTAARNTQKAQRARKPVCRASSTVRTRPSHDEIESTHVPAKPRLKFSNATPPRRTEVDTSTKGLPVSVSDAAFWMFRIASAEDCCTLSTSSFRRPSSPVALFPRAFLQNQHECAFTLRSPTIERTRLMCSTFKSRPSIAAAKPAVSSKMARTSVMARPSTSSIRLIMVSLLMPSSMPRNIGPSGEPFSVSSASVKRLHNISVMPPLISPV